MRLLIKVFIAAFLLGSLLIASGLLLIQYSPQSLLSLSQYVSPYHLVAEEIDIDLSTPSVNISGLQVNSADETAITLENFSFSTSWKSLEANSQEWAGVAKNGVIHLNKLGHNFEGTTSATAPPETSAPNIDGLHNMLQKANIAAENILVHITNTSSAKLNYLRRPEVLQAEEQGIEFSILYQQDASTLPLQGTLLSTIGNSASGNVPQITLNVPLVDLRTIMSVPSANQDQPLAPTDTATHSQKESSIDWSPLSQLTTLDLIFRSEKIQIPQGDITNIRSRISLTNENSVQGILHEHTANVALTINNDIAVNQPVALRADWKVLREKTNGPDITGSTVFSLGDDNIVGNSANSSINITGTMNLNGILGQDIVLTTAIKQLPGKTLSKSATQLKKELERLLPLKANAKLNLQEGKLTLDNMTVNAKDSNINGSLALGFDTEIMDLRTVAFDINSTRLVIPQLSTTPVSAAPAKPNDVISLQWLNNVEAKGKITIGEIIYKNETLVDNARVQLNLQKNQLTIKDAAINTKDSDLNGNVTIGFDKNISTLRTITFDLNSKKLVIPEFAKKTETPKTQSASEKTTSNIPVDWLNTIKVNGKVNIGELTYKNDIIVTSARTELILDKNQLSLSDIAITTKDSDINGKVSVDLNQKATHFYAITFDLDSSQLVIPDTQSTVKEISGPQPTSTNSTLFTDDALPTDWLNTVKAEGNINIAKVIRNNTTLVTNADIHITLDKDILKLDGQIGGIAGGKSSIRLSINNTDNKLAIVMHASAKDIILEKLALLPKEELTGGKTSLELSLNSYGVSTKALAAHLQGNLLLVATDGVIANNTFELIGSDVLLKLLNSINPFYKSSKTTNLECAVIHSKITDGKMLFDDSIAVKTSKMIIIGNGNINLATEKINIDINPKARAGVGIDVASLAKFIAVQGELSQPSIGVSGKGTAKSLLSIGAAISTGGLSLLATKLTDTVISGDACKLAIDAFTKKVRDTPTNATLN